MGVFVYQNRYMNIIGALCKIARRDNNQVLFLRQCSSHEKPQKLYLSVQTNSFLGVFTQAKNNCVILKVIILISQLKK